jgi:hypothetical protein
VTGVVRSYVGLVRGPLGIVAVYAILWRVFAARSAHHGLLGPSGDVDAGVAVLGLVVLVLRIVVLFVLPAFLTYRSAMRLLTGDTARAKGDTPEE